MGRGFFLQYRDKQLQGFFFAQGRGERMRAGEEGRWFFVRYEEWLQLSSSSTHSVYCMFVAYINGGKGLQHIVDWSADQMGTSGGVI